MKRVLRHMVFLCALLTLTFCFSAVGYAAVVSGPSGTSVPGFSPVLETGVDATADDPLCAPLPDGEEIADEAAPLAASPSAPLTALPNASWALGNLLLTIFTLCGSAVLMLGSVRLSAPFWKGPAPGPGSARAISLIPSACALIAFFMLENLRGALIWFDRWTPLFCTAAAVQVLIVLLARREQLHAQSADV